MHGNSKLDHKSRRGEPSHFVLLRAIARQQQHAFDCLRQQIELDDRSEVGTIISNRAQCRVLTLNLLLEELVWIALENEWPIPPEVVVDLDESAEEGQ